jgi:alkylated DNA repair dioxygenase AlkB
MTDPTRTELTIDRQAATRRIELAKDAWVDLTEGFVRAPDEELATLLDTTPWQQTEVLRYDRYVPEQRVSAGLAAEHSPLLRHVEAHLRSRHRQRFDGVAAIQYRTGEDFQGLHSDREMRWLDETLIAIVVLGARRPFVLRPRAPLAEVVERIPAGTHPDDIVLMPGRGDMLVMGGTCQRTWLHGVPKAPEVREPRVSLTWRWTSRRGRPDTNPGYYDGRQFSDRPRQAGYRSSQS